MDQHKPPEHNPGEDRRTLNSESSMIQGTTNKIKEVMAMDRVGKITVGEKLREEDIEYKLVALPSADNGNKYKFISADGLFSKEYTKNELIRAIADGKVFLEGKI